MRFNVTLEESSASLAKHLAVDSCATPLSTFIVPISPLSAYIVTTRNRFRGHAGDVRSLVTEGGQRYLLKSKGKYLTKLV